MNYYEVLGVARSATGQQITTAYRELAKKYHPDANMNLPPKEKAEAEDRFKEITEAYETLRSSRARRRYDQTLPEEDQADQAGGTAYGEWFSGERARQMAREYERTHKKEDRPKKRRTRPASQTAGRHFYQSEEEQPRERGRQRTEQEKRRDANFDEYRSIVHEVEQLRRNAPIDTTAFNDLLLKLEQLAQRFDNRVVLRTRDEYLEELKILNQRSASCDKASREIREMAEKVRDLAMRAAEEGIRLHKEDSPSKDCIRAYTDAFTAAEAAYQTQYEGPSAPLKSKMETIEKTCLGEIKAPGTLTRIAEARKLFEDAGKILAPIREDIAASYQNRFDVSSFLTATAARSGQVLKSARDKITGQISGWKIKIRK